MALVGKSRLDPKQVANAQKMYQYCVSHNFGKGMNEKWGVKHFLLIEQSLQNDEKVYMCFIGLHNYKSITQHDKNFAYALTNKRFLIAQQKPIGQVIQSVYLDNLNDVTMNTGMMMGVLTFDTMKEKFNVCVEKGACKEINEKIHVILNKIKASKSAVQNSAADGAAEEILKYKSLLDKGIITEEEFSKKKRQLLGI